MSATLPAISFIGLGIVNAFMEKILYNEKAIGLPELGIHYFIKPNFYTICCFFGYMMSTLMYVYQHFKNPNKNPAISSFPKSAFFCLALSGCLDLFQGVMSSITIAFVGVSVDYMMRTATLVGVSLIGRFFFKRRIRKAQWVSITIIVAALLVIGFSFVYSAGSSKTVRVSPEWCVVIVLLKFVSQILYSVKLSIEQYCTQQKHMAPTLVCGIQGTCSFLVGAFVLLPILHNLPENPLREDTIDTFLMLKNNPRIVLIILLAIGFDSLYNASSVTLTSKTSAIIRTIVEAFRTFLIWVCQLSVYYICSSYQSLAEYSQLGEAWGRGSKIQMFGFFVMLIGIVMYRNYRQPVDLLLPGLDDIDDK